MIDYMALIEHFNKMDTNVNLMFTDDSLLVLSCFSDFKEWYLNQYNFSSFSQEDIWALLEEEQPNSYPCTPLVTSNFGEVFYLNLKELDVKKTKKNTNLKLS